MPGFIEPLRQQLNNLHAAKKVENGRVLLPNKHGDDGWYGHGPNLRFDVQRDIYLWSLKPSDKERIQDGPVDCFSGRPRPGLPVPGVAAGIRANPVKGGGSARRHQHPGFAGLGLFPALQSSRDDSAGEPDARRQ